MNEIKNIIECKSKVIRRLYRFSMALLLAFLITACGGSSSDSAVTDNQEICEKIDSCGDSTGTEKTDTDNDGVKDDVDECTDTPATEILNINTKGCHDFGIPAPFLGINASGSEYRTKAGFTYIADTHFVGGKTYNPGATEISGTDDDEILSSERWGDFSYKIPVDNGDYGLVLKFVEQNQLGIGLRVFNVAVEESVVGTNVDVYAEVGKNTLYEITVDDIKVTDGSIDIVLTSVQDYAKISGILVVKNISTIGDEDIDGIYNRDDECSYTAVGDVVDSNGCSSVQLDSDLDHVNNNIDLCPNTLPADIALVDGNGCAPEQFDEDNDTIIDDNDQCDATPANELVNNNGCSFSQLDDDGDTIMNDVDHCDNTLESDLNSIDTKGCSPVDNQALTAPFLEENGLIVIETESLSYPTGWERETGNQSTGNAYIIWKGGDYFGAPGSGVISFEVSIQSAGVYHFVWRNIIGHGNSPSDANDSWLKILSNNFYGYQLGKDIVCPNEQEASNSCVGVAPRGSSANGWFKVFRSGTPVNEWKWGTGTSDFQGHGIFAEFDEPGVYKIQISARSKHHGIDRVVLFRDRNATDNVDFGFAASPERKESIRDLSQ